MASIVAPSNLTYGQYYPYFYQSPLYAPYSLGIPERPYRSLETAVSATEQITTSRQVYEFVPGSQHHKRRRRRYEEIERNYMCGWQDCKKAYGTLNHLNAHVTMQSHGSKRIPEEFKDAGKKWKQRKIEDDAQQGQVDSQCSTSSTAQRTYDAN